MIKKHIYFLSILTLLFSFSCKRDQKGESINYAALTEERIMKVAEQATITNDDISSLERLLEKVTDNATQTRLGTLLSGVKSFKEVITGLIELKTNPEINFQELYASLTAKLKTATDLLPRKLKLQKELEDAQANYSKEEYTYQEWVVKEAGLGAFLATNYNIQPVAGKPYSFLRKDIEGVDSLVLTIGTNEFPDRIPYTVIKTFKGLRSLNTVSLDVDTLNLNYLKNLQRLVVGYKKSLKIDSCQQLKYLEIVGGNGFGETIDFTNKYPDLETLILNKDIVPNLVTVLLPNKKRLKRLKFPVTSVREGLPNIKKLVIEAGGELEFGIQVGATNNMTIDEIRISGCTNSFSLSGFTTTTAQTIVKKLELKDINVKFFLIGGMNLSENLDLGILPAVESLNINSFSVNGQRAGINNCVNIEKHAATAKTLNLNEVRIPGGVLDLSAWKKLTLIGINTESANTKDAPLRKLIVNKATHDAVGSCNDCMIDVWSSVGDVEVEVAQ